MTARGPAISPEEGEKERSLVWRFDEDYVASIKKPADASRARRMFRTGAALVDENCADLFAYLGRARQNLTAGQRATGLAGGVTSGVMALTGVSAKAIGLVATSFTALLAGSEIYGETYLFAPDTSAVQKAVASAQAVYAADIEKQMATWSSDGGQADFFAAAHQAVRGYQGLCEVHSIRQIVDDAIASAKFGVDREPSDARDRAAAIIESSVRSRVAEEIRVASADIDDQRLAALLVFTTNRLSIPRETVRRMLDGWNGPNAKPVFDIVSAGDAAGTRLRSTLAGLFAILPDASKARLEKIASDFSAGAVRSARTTSAAPITLPVVRATR